MGRAHYTVLPLNRIIKIDFQAPSPEIDSAVVRDPGDSYHYVYSHYNVHHLLRAYYFQDSAQGLFVLHLLSPSHV